MAKPYDQIPDRRAIIRRRALEEALAKLVEDLPTGSEPPRPQVLALVRDALATGRAEIRRRFEAPGPLRNDGPAVPIATTRSAPPCSRHVISGAIASCSMS